MSVLDELRSELRAVVTWRGAGEEMYWGDDVYRILDAFEAAHPGLVDETDECPRCGKPTVLDGRHKDLRLGYLRSVCLACAEEGR